MWLYFEYGKIRFNIYGDKESLNTLSVIFKLSFNNISLLERKDMESDWTIYTYKNSIYDTYVDREKNIIIFRYNTDLSFFEIFGLIKEAIVKFTIEKGWLWVHASCFVMDGKTYLVMGKKGDGKTTTLLHASMNNNGRIIGNDQIPLFLSNENLYTCTWRPDVKSTFKTFKLLDNSIEINNINNVNKRIIIFPDKDCYNAFDFKGFYKVTGQEVIPYTNYSSLCFKYADKGKYKINYVILLREELENEWSCDRAQILKVFEDIYSDKEFITPTKAMEWSKYINYWNKRITRLIIPKESIELEKKIISHLLNNTNIKVVKTRQSLNNFSKIISN